ncbi:MAG: hypothetical protein IT378_11650 [Sandaracinaceae bacterium]|nr:hypothetical protein [Sandaracinaceae bacterium]
MTACGAPPGGDAGTDAGMDASSGPDSLTTIGSLDELGSLAGSRGEVKWLSGADGVAPRAPIGAGCLFQNTARWPYHIQFLLQLPETATMTFDEYVDAVLRRPTRSWWGGEVRFAPGVAHPLTGEPGTLLYSLYTEDTAGSRLVAGDVREVDRRMRECMPFAASQLAFVPGSNEQLATATSIRAELAAEGIAIVLP